MKSAGDTDEHDRGVVRRKILINPGPSYLIKIPSRSLEVYGVFIAASSDSIVQMRPGYNILRPNQPANGGVMISKYFRPPPTASFMR